jgi:threonine dehydratase
MIASGSVDVESPTLPSLAEIREAQKLIYTVMQPTPQISWPLLNEVLKAEVWVKHENHTPTGAFKARTAVVYAAELFKGSTQIRGLIAATRGNHGQSVALAGRRFAVPVTIVVPFGNSSEKNAAMRSQGANVIEHGLDYQEAREHAEVLAAQQGLHFVPAFHRNIVKGVATYWLEFFEAVSDIDCVYVPIGMGSGICAACAVRNGMGLNTKIVGVVSELAPAYALSFEARKAVSAPATTAIADGIACRTPDEAAVAIICKNVERILRVTDDEIRAAMKLFFTATHNVVEGAGAASLAAALQEKEMLAGKRVGVIATGGNVDHDVFAGVLRPAV